MKSEYFKGFMVGIFLTFFLQSEAFSRQISDREKNGLVGPVKSVHVEMESNLLGQSTVSQQYTEIFDERGNLIERIKFSSPNEQYPSEKWGFVYDSKGNILERRYYGSDEIIVRKDQYAYTNEASGKQTEIISYAYGADGSNGEFIGGEKYFYDSEGNLKEEYYLPNDRSVTTKKIYTYDAKGNKTTEIDYCPGCSAILSKKVMVYDKNGKIIETQEYKGDSSLLRKNRMSYDERGNQISISSYDSDGHLEFKEIRSYEYDKIGNWIKRIERIDHKNSKQSVITIFRKIVYF